MLLRVILFYFQVYIRTDKQWTSLFSDYTDLIQPLANIGQIQFIENEPTEGFTNIVSTSDYSFYFKTQ